MKKYVLLLIILFGAGQLALAQEDTYQWLEEVDGEKALEFVNEQNAATVKELSAEKNYESIYNQCLEIYNSDDRIAYPTTYGKYVYNFWKDKNNVRGIWRRCLLSDYNKGITNWETLLDIDALSEKDDVKWVYKGASGLYPNYERFLVRLSKGGGDAVVIKEFDVTEKQFVEDGFFVPEAKGSASYIDENTVIIGSNFGEGTMTTSGYPRQVKVWKRGADLKDAKMIYEGEASDVGTWGGVFRDGSTPYTWVSQSLTFYTRKSFLWHENEMVQLDIPLDAGWAGVLNDQMLLRLKSDWTVKEKTYKTGSLISLDFSELIKGNKDIQVIIEPDEFSSISSTSTTKNKLLINLLTNVTNHLYIYSFEDGGWSKEKIDAPGFGSISIVDVNENTDDFFFSFRNFITPTTLYGANAANNTFKAYKALPAFFDADKYEVNQFKAKSKDGTMIPYFLVSSKNMKLDGNNPTLVYAYGGFEASMTPFYASTYGVSWLDNGGAFVLANIRGGGEFGPKWHQAGLKEKRQNVFDDLYAVSEDVISKKVASPKTLGVMGGSNGGLLVGVAFTQRPDLYNAVVCQVPLLDMQRYSKLLAGASWMGEYGNPDTPEEWAYIKKYSPYHNVKKGMDYPEVFFTTSTRDDRVHPGHARKMVAKMNDMGYKSYYYENTEGGHAGTSTNEQRAKSTAMLFSYLLMKLKHSK